MGNRMGDRAEQERPDSASSGGADDDETAAGGLLDELGPGIAERGNGLDGEIGMTFGDDLGDSTEVAPGPLGHDVEVEGVRPDPRIGADRLRVAADDPQLGTEPSGFVGRPQHCVR